MLFTVAGTQNVGKTTFLQDFLKAFPEFTKPEVDYRKIILSKGLKINREGNLYSQESLFNFTLNDLFSRYSDVSHTILDRSILDAYVYTYWLYKNKPEESGITEFTVLKQHQTVNNNIGRFDRIFYIPLSKCQNVVVVDDEFRDTDLEYRAQIGDIFNNTIKELNLKNVFEVYGNREERIELVRNAGITSI
jgi:hypothetical protein